MVVANGRFRFAIDRGGTFTDIYAEQPDGTVRLLKLLSEDKEHYSDAPQEGIRRIIAEFYGTRHHSTDTIDPHVIEWIRMGTTVATNALLERRGERCILLVTAGLRDLLQIGYQSRPDIFDLRAARAAVLYEDVAEIPERVRLVSAAAYESLEAVERQHLIATRTGQWVQVLRPPALDVAESALKEALQKGIRSVAVVFMHAYAYDTHEQQVGHLALSLGFQHVTLSSSLTNMQRVVPRGLTCLVDAYLTPCLRKYLESFRDGFKGRLQDTLVELMQSDGGLCPLESFTGYKAILSGPAGGVVGYAKTIYPLTALSSPDGKPQPVIGFDMGGTSTDVSRYAGQLEHVLECETAGVMIQAPQLDIQTVAAGGGSRLFYRSGLLQVGPESAAADPGPVCYRKPGGQLAVTDANVVLGRLQPRFFPSIFGPDQNETLDVEAARAAFASLREQLTRDDPERNLLSIEELALGFIRVANEAMCRPIRSMTESRGYDPAQHVLACFGGAGGQHACAIARNLGMSTVYVHRYAGVLSAYGIGLSESVEDLQEPCALELARDLERAQQLLQELELRCRKALERRGIASDRIQCERFLHLRYQGTDLAMLISEPGAAATCEDYASAFEQAYEREHGFLLRGRSILIDNVRVRVAGQSTVSPVQTYSTDATGAGHSDSGEVASTRAPGPQQQQQQQLETLSSTGALLSVPEPLDMAAVYFATGWHTRTPVYALEKLAPYQTFSGPALLVDPAGGITILVEPACQAAVLADRTIRIDLSSVAGAATHSSSSSSSTDSLSVAQSVIQVPDAVKRSIFAHRFMSIAEQMGRTLQRTAVSTNIKERLDFSCALFDAKGGLVANAPHIPVHLGSMQDAVRQQVTLLGADWLPGEVVMTNHPAMGGTHLPDITVITPVFHDGRPVFFVASRGHHADVGGLTPGSMPPFSRTLAEEGAAIASLKLVQGGVFQEGRVRELLQHAGCRCLHDVLSDLRAQIAANQRGIQLMNQLIQEQGLGVVEHFMHEIQRTAAGFVRDVLRQVGKRHGKRTPTGRWLLEAADVMDDGSRIQLRVEIDDNDNDNNNNNNNDNDNNVDDGCSAVFDFTGTDAQVVANWNAPPSVAASAIIYCLRCLIGRDVPLNQGFLDPITIRIPAGCLLDPHPEAAVVGGNVLTSQRVTDVVLRAFGACAASQGCMNNLTFGTEHWSYYETIGGGSGAGPGWHGEHGIQVHMTNTRMTDPELLEWRYPVLLRRFRLRSGSGGRGRWSGGNGIERELEFLEDGIQVSILSERRVFAPFGLAGGEAGARGRNWLIRAPDTSRAARAETKETDPQQTLGASAPSSSSSSSDIVDGAAFHAGTVQAAAGGLVDTAGRAGQPKSHNSETRSSVDSWTRTEAPLESAWLDDQAGVGSHRHWLVNLGNKQSIRVVAGDRIRICTPGGGGYGTPGAVVERNT